MNMNTSNVNTSCMSNGSKIQLVRVREEENDYPDSSLADEYKDNFFAILPTV